MFEGYNTAKTYEAYEKIGEPYKASNFKWYIKVKNPNTGTIRDVRLYNPAELKKMYPEYVAINNNKYYKTQKQVLGFDNDYIWIFKGNTYAHLDWFRESSCKYNKWFGWHCTNLPVDYPIDLTPIKVEWDKVGTPEGKLLPDDKITLYMDSILYDDDPSEWQGKIGDKVVRELTITDIKTLQGGYGVSTLYNFIDANSNKYSWITSTSKDWEVEDVVKLSGTIKELKTYHNVKTTTITRCREVK